MSNLNIIALQSILDVQIWYLRSLIALEAMEMISSLSVIEDILAEEELHRFSQEYPELYSFGRSDLDCCDLYSIDPSLSAIKYEYSKSDLSYHLGEYIPPIVVNNGVIDYELDDVDTTLVTNWEVIPAHIRFSATERREVPSSLRKEAMVTYGDNHKLEAVAKKHFKAVKLDTTPLKAHELIASVTSQSLDPSVITVKLYMPNKDGSGLKRRKVTPIQMEIKDDNINLEDIGIAARDEFIGRGVNIFPNNIIIASGSGLRLITDMVRDNDQEWLESLEPITEQFYIHPPKAGDVTVNKIVDKAVKHNIATGAPTDLPRNLTQQWEDYQGLIDQQKADPTAKLIDEGNAYAKAMAETSPVAVHKELLSDMQLLIANCATIKDAIEAKNKSIDVLFLRLRKAKITHKVNFPKSFYAKHYRQVEKMIINKFGQTEFIAATKPEAAKLKEANEKINEIVDSIKGNPFTKAKMITNGEVDISIQMAKDAIEYAKMDSNYRLPVAVYKALITFINTAK